MDAHCKSEEAKCNSMQWPGDRQIDRKVNMIDRCVDTNVICRKR